MTTDATRLVNELNRLLRDDAIDFFKSICYLESDLIIKALRALGDGKDAESQYSDIGKPREEPRK